MARRARSSSSSSAVTRMLFSLFSAPSSTLNMDDDEVVADFVRSHVVRGFTNDRAGRSR